MARPRPVPKTGAPVVKVRAKSPELAKHLNLVVHRANRLKFNKEGIADWPYDSYTHRRIVDGDVTLVTEKELAPPSRSTHHRETKPAA